MRRKLAAGNWKMFGTTASLGEIAAIAGACPTPGVDILVCLPATLISRAQAVAGCVALGGQDCHAHGEGAHTGDISAPMLIDAGASHVILGHSERRSDYRESDETVAAKALSARAAGLTAVICVGETLEQRQSGDALAVVGGQLAGSIPDGASGANTVVAYEPVWAIGTGLTPSVEEIGEMHGFIRRALRERFGTEGDAIRVLYGGSVKPANAADIFAVPDVDGALVGGASLKAADFLPIVRALEGAAGQ
ncbi:MAG: triose-phosphate isomerase [Rubellimicrobium sp.]|nr:triose-phosphate isomerase [Rubellimicrobium sp.]